MTTQIKTASIEDAAVTFGKLAGNIIASASSAAIALADMLLFADVTAANATRRATVSDIIALVQAASETAAGVIEIATAAEATTGTDDTRAITPLKLTTFSPATDTPDTGADTFLFFDATDNKIKKGTLPSSSPDLIHLRQSLASGSFQGSTGGAWTKCPINTEVVDTGGHCTLSSSVFTLAAGTYEIWAWQFLFNSDTGKLRLRNTSDGATTIVGGNSFAGGAVGASSPPMLVGRFTIAGSKNFELQYYATTASASRGLGYEASSGEAEVYCDVWLKKVA